MKSEKFDAIVKTIHLSAVFYVFNFLVKFYNFITVCTSIASNVFSGSPVCQALCRQSLQLVPSLPLPRPYK